LPQRPAEQLESEAKPVKKKTKPRLHIPHLDDALAALATARQDKVILRTNSKAAIRWVEAFLCDQFHVELPDDKQRTLGRRIAERFGDKSPS
jgi:hypothetical protein